MKTGAPRSRDPSLLRRLLKRPAGPLALSKSIACVPFSVRAAAQLTPLIPAPTMATSRCARFAISHLVICGHEGEILQRALGLLRGRAPSRRGLPRGRRDGGQVCRADARAEAAALKRRGADPDSLERLAWMDCGAAESIARTHGTDATGAPRAHGSEPAACRRLRAPDFRGAWLWFAGLAETLFGRRTQLMVDVGDDGWLSSRKGVVCFERAVVPGESDYLVRGPADARWVRHAAYAAVGLPRLADHPSATNRTALVVDREDAKDIDARFLYRAVPVGTLATNPTLASAFHLSPKAKAKKREQALAAHLRGASGKKALTKKLLDIGALVAARGILAKGDVSAACAVAKQRRTDPGAGLPTKVRAAVEAWLATVSGG